LKIIKGDCIDELKKLKDNSVDAIVTDPPYGLSFMGNKWDYDVPSVEIWKECLRVLKSGAFLLSFAGTRTYHRMAVNIEDAGFEIRDMISWLYGSGFPKSHNISKNIEKQIDSFIKENDLDLIWKNKQIINVFSVEEQLKKSQIEHGMNTEKRSFVVENVLESINTENNLLAVKIVENNSLGTKVISKNTFIVLTDVNLKNATSEQNVKFAIKKLLKNEANVNQINTFIVEGNVKDLLKEQIMDKIKAEGLQRIWLGKLLSSKNQDLNVICVEMIENLKHIILNQLKNFQNSDMKYLMDNVSVTNVIITKSTMECLISFMEDILKGEILSYKRKIIGEKNRGDVQKAKENGVGYLSDPANRNNVKQFGYGKEILTKGTSEWEGWGTALKPACEPIVVARKPLSEKNVALNVLKWGTGGINIDACRVGFRNEEDKKETVQKNRHGDFNSNDGIRVPSHNGIYHGDNRPPINYEPQGRFPANIILDEEAGRRLDEQSGISKSSDAIRNNNISEKSMWGSNKGGGFKDYSGTGFKDKGGASRFFYCAKASKKERNLGTDSFIKLEVLKVICEENNLIKEERLVELLVDMDTLQGRDIEESGVEKKKGCEWNTILFGKKLMEKYQQDIQSIIKMETNSTIQLKILSWLKHLFIKEYTLDANSLKESGGNLAGNVEKSKELTITISEKLALALGVKDVVSGMQLKIRLKEGSNFHPTCKSLAIMEYLIKLVSKENVVVLDPFMGSGTTGIACVKLNREFIGMERDEDYIKIAESRINAWKELNKEKQTKL